MEQSRAEFIHHLNVANYEKMLSEAPDAVRRKLLMTLLCEERAAATAQGWISAQR